jgi:putative transposase
VFHIVNRGKNHRAVFFDDLDRQTYLANLTRVVEAKEWRPLTLCLMTNHIHLVVETPLGNMADGMQQLHGRYVQTFNARHGEDGALFRGRYRWKRIKDDAQLAATIRYVVLNPHEAGLSESAGHAWSSHDAVVEGRDVPWLDRDRLLYYFSAGGGDPLQRYLDTVSSGLPETTAAAQPSALSRL